MVCVCVKFVFGGFLVGVCFGWLICFCLGFAWVWCGVGLVSCCYLLFVITLW